MDLRPCIAIQNFYFRILLKVKNDLRLRLNQKELRDLFRSRARVIIMIVGVAIIIFVTSYFLTGLGRLEHPRAYGLECVSVRCARATVTVRFYLDPDMYYTSKNSMTYFEWMYNVPWEMDKRGVLHYPH